MLKNLRAIAIWLLPPLGVFALPIDAPELTCLAMLQLYLGGLLLAPVFFIKFFATRSKPHSASAVVMVAVLWIIAWQHGFTLGARIHLLVNERRYMETIVALSKASSPEEKARICGDGCMPSATTEPVIFHYCHCPFNWPDLVYDPTGKFDDPPDPAQMSYSYLRGSKQLSKNWYIGYYGD